MHHLPALIPDLTLISIYAGITILLFKWLKQPVVLGYILAGIVAGPYLTLFPSVTDKENVSTLAEIGVIFLLFSLGLEFSFKKIVNVGKTAIIAAMTNIIFMLFIGYVAGQMLGWTTTDSLFLGGMISMSSTTIIIKAFEELNLKKQKFTDLVFGILVVEDLVGILLLVLLPTVAISQSVDGLEMISSTLKLIFFLIMCFIVGVYLVPTFLKKVTVYLNDEILLIISIGLCMGMVMLATSSGFSSALGAFIMGSILAETAFAHRMENVLKPVKDFFGAVFFVSVGMMVDPAMFVTYAWPILCITIVVVSGKVFFTCLGMTISGQSMRTSVLCGFSLAQVGEFAFIIASLGMSLGVLSEYVYPTIVAVSVITTFTTPMMIKSASPVYTKLKSVMPAKIQAFYGRTFSRSGADSPAEISLWNKLFKHYLLRIVIFSVILISILGLSAAYISPFIREWVPGLSGRILTTLLVLGMMAPFLNALLLFRGKYTTIYMKLWDEKKQNRLPLTLLTAFRIVIVALFGIVTMHLFLTTNMKVTLIFVALLIGILFKSKWVLRQYTELEKRFLSNLNGETVAQEHKELPVEPMEEPELKATEQIPPENPIIQNEPTVIVVASTLRPTESEQPIGASETIVEEVATITTESVEKNPSEKDVK